MSLGWRCHVGNVVIFHIISGNRAFIFQFILDSIRARRPSCAAGREVTEESSFTFRKIPLVTGRGFLSSAREGCSEECLFWVGEE